MTNDRRRAWWIGCGGGAAAGLVVHVAIAFFSPIAEPAVELRRDAVLPIDVVGGGVSPRSAIDAGVLQRLVDEVAKLRERLGEMDANAPDRTSSGAPTPVLDETMLVAALRRVRALEEEEHFAALTEGELFAEAERLLRADKMDRLASRRMLQSVLARPPASTSPEMRASTLMLLAQVQRDLNDIPAAASALQRVVDDFGLSSDLGSHAGNQLALLAASTKDYATGIALAERIARVAPVEAAFEARWGVGFLQRMSGDVTTARATLEQVVRDCTGRPELEHIVTMCQRDLEAMEH